jgi:hypothetical protein
MHLLPLIFFGMLTTLGVAAGIAGWQLISRDIGGGPLGVAFFPDGLSGITAVSQILPAGYEAKQSKDGGYTWNTVPDQDLFIFGLSNVVTGLNNTGVISGDSFVQVTTNGGANFSWASGASAGGEIARRIFDASGTPSGFSILGISNDGANGFVWTREPLGKWTSVNVVWESPEIISIDGAFAADAWTVVGNEYSTGVARTWRGASSGGGRAAAARARARAAARSGASAKTSAKTSAAAYRTEVVVSTDEGATFKTVYKNASVAALGIACIDSNHCCFVGEDADYAYIFSTNDGWATVRETLADTNEGAALVEVSVAWGACAGGADAYVAVGGYVAATQSPVWYRSCDAGTTWTKDAAPNWPVFGLLNTDIDCIKAANGTECWTTLWDDSGIDPNGFVARYFAA